MDPSHLEATCRWLSDPRLRRQIDSLEAPTPDRNREYWSVRWNDVTQETFAILSSEGEHVGNCGLVKIDEARSKAELWIYLGQARGRGVGTRAVSLLLQRGFEGLGLNRIYLRVVSDNARAIEFYRRLGFTVEGTSRQDTVHEGTRLDSVWMSMLAAEHTPRARGPTATRPASAPSSRSLRPRRRAR